MFRTRGFKFIVQSDRLLKSFKVVSAFFYGLCFHHPQPPRPHPPTPQCIATTSKNQKLIFSKLCFTQ